MATDKVSLTLAMEREAFDDIGDRLIRSYYAQRGSKALFKVIREGLSNGTLEETEAADLCELGEYAMERLDHESEALFNLATDLKSVSGQTDPILHHNRGPST
ncbi:hypothetical protein MWU54_10370 [Marivita sp. S6314]|uniref:hypothetical protein n=1 Tax=Marivita sp. S6314 TaxID=2926406 RepID=UPI001FF55505|nr:hypothetical protein [Marivita sp. S6314]MCK0150429.1 hypothetical protein [Marivita sp. S6314]